MRPCGHTDGAFSDDVIAASIAAHIVQMLPVLRKSALSECSEQDFMIVSDNLGRLLTTVLNDKHSEPVLFALVITDVNGRTQLTSNMESPQAASEVLDAVQRACADMDQKFRERN